MMWWSVTSSSCASPPERSSVVRSSGARLRSNGRRDLLHRRAVHLAEARSQSLVPAHHLPQAALEHRGLDVSPQPQGERQVVQRAPRLQLVEEPQALLRERQAERPRSGCPQDRRNDQLAARPQLRFHVLRQARNRRRQEYLAQGDAHLEGLLHPRHDLRRQQRVAAQLKEAVLHSHPWDAQHPAPDPRDQLLCRCAGIP